MIPLGVLASSYVAPAGGGGPVVGRWLVTATANATSSAAGTCHAYTNLWNRCYMATTDADSNTPDMTTAFAAGVTVTLYNDATDDLLYTGTVSTAWNGALFQSDSIGTTLSASVGTVIRFESSALA